MDAEPGPTDLLGALERGGEPVAIPVLALHPALIRAVQDRLAAHGLLDPPADGYLGPVTQWALSQFCRLAGMPFENALTPPLAAALLLTTPILPLQPGDDLAGRVVAAMLRRGNWVCRHPDCLTIVYAEGIGPDGRSTASRPNAFEDTRLLIRVVDGRPEIAGAWEATTAPGRPATEEPAEQAGAPWLHPGQYKAWVMGRTGVGTFLEQDALVQAVPLPVTPDEERDFRRSGGLEWGMFVLDQHGGFDSPREAVGGIGSGCLVGRLQAGQRRFIANLRTDPRWRVNNAYRFMTAVLDPSQLAAPWPPSR